MPLLLASWAPRLLANLSRYLVPILVDLTNLYNSITHAASVALTSALNSALVVSPALEAVVGFMVEFGFESLVCGGPTVVGVVTDLKSALVEVILF